ncbi:MAG: MtrB/PioB family outer membrane beta-barrel protein [Betaproteobacteria bacterium]|nr:MtrB/PioB family outer membrane beta-barrel protein [Betaproteobacteria bacterium]
MKTIKQNLCVSQTILAIAVLAAIGQARAQTDVVKDLTTPDSSVTIGVGGVDGDEKDRAQYGMFNGMRKDSGYLLFDLDYATRDNATGTWTTLQGRNLGLSNRELRGGMQKQGDWKVYGEYNEIIRYSPFSVNTAMQNAGSTKPIVIAIPVAGTGNDLDFKLQRKAASAGMEKWLSPNLKFEATIKSEDKDGTRMWGRGYDCAGYVCGSSTTTAINQANFLKNAILMIPEPINSNIKQFDAKFVFHDEKMNLTAAYYGSFYTNENGNISPVVPNSLYGGNQTLVAALYPAVGTNIIAGGGTSLQNVLQSPMALQPDNQAHQFSLAGNYAFSPKVKATFKYSYTHASQNRDFAGMGLSGSAPGAENLGGRVDTVAAQFGLTYKPMRDLNLLANINYARKEDKTPNALYNVEAKAVFPATTPTSYTNLNQIGVPGAVWNNNHVSNTNLVGKLEATYRLPENFRLTAGVDYRLHERLVPESRVEEALAGLGPLREKNTETGYRIDLRRNMSDTLNGSIGVSTSKRGGSDWTNLSTLNPGAPTTISAVNTYLINTYCGGRECYGQVLPAGAILQLSANTPFPSSMADVQRDKWKVSVDWTPFEKLSLQLTAEDGKDKNTMPVDPAAGGKGWRDSGVSFYGVDVTYALSDSWRLTGYVSQGEQTNHINHSTGYVGDLKNRSEALGMSLTGQASSKLQVGANLTYINDINKYGSAAATGTSGDRLTGLTVTQPSATNLAQAAVGLPDVTFRKAIVSVFGQYTLDKKSDVRLDLAHQKAKYDDWVWGTTNNPFVFSDNTSVKQQVDQTVTFVGVTYIYKFR